MPFGVVIEALYSLPLGAPLLASLETGWLLAPKSLGGRASEVPAAEVAAQLLGAVFCFSGMSE